MILRVINRKKINLTPFQSIFQMDLRRRKVHSVSQWIKLKLKFWNLHMKTRVVFVSFNFLGLNVRSKCKEWCDTYRPLTLNQRTVANTSTISLFIPYTFKILIPYSQTLVVSRICSSEKDFKTHILLWSYYKIIIRASAKV